MQTCFDTIVFGRHCVGGVMQQLHGVTADPATAGAGLMGIVYAGVAVILLTRLG